MADNLRGLDLKALSKKCHALVVEYFNDLDGAKVGGLVETSSVCTDEE